MFHLHSSKRKPSALDWNNSSSSGTANVGTCSINSSSLDNHASQNYYRHAPEDCYHNGGPQPPATNSSYQSTNLLLNTSNVNYQNNNHQYGSYSFSTTGQSQGPIVNSVNNSSEENSHKRKFDSMDENPIIQDIVEEEDQSPTSVSDECYRDVKRIKTSLSNLQVSDQEQQPSNCTQLVCYQDFNAPMLEFNDNERMSQHPDEDDRVHNILRRRFISSLMSQSNGDASRYFSPRTDLVFHSNNKSDKEEENTALVLYKDVGRDELLKRITNNSAFNSHDCSVDAMLDD